MLGGRVFPSDHLRNLGRTLSFKQRTPFGFDRDWRQMLSVCARSQCECKCGVVRICTVGRQCVIARRQRNLKLSVIPLRFENSLSVLEDIDDQPP